MSKFYTVKEVADALEFSTNTVYKYLDEEKIKATRLGAEGRFRIPEEEVIRLLQLKGDNPQVAPQITIPLPPSQPASPTSFDVARSEGFQLHPPHLLDWYISLIALLVSFAYFLFPLYRDIPYESYKLSLQLIKINLIGFGVGLIVINLLGWHKSRWHRFIHIGMGLLFAAQAFIFWKTGDLMGTGGNLALALLSLTTNFIKINDFLKFTAYVFALGFGIGAIFIYDSSFLPNRFLATWISEHNVLFAVFWYLIFFIFVGNLLFGFRRLFLIFATFLPVAMIYFAIAGFSMDQGLWGQVVYTIVLGSFLLIFPSWRHVESFGRIARRELLEASAWMTAVFVIGIALVFYMQYSFKSYVLDQNRKSATAATTIIESTVEGSKKTIMSFALNSNLVELMSKPGKNDRALEQVVKEFYLQSSTFRRIAISDETGNRIAVYPQENTPGINVFDMPFQEAKKTKNLVVNASNTVLVAMPILNTEGEFAGVIAGGIDLLKLEEKLRGLQFGSYDYFVVANEREEIILHPDSDQLHNPITYNSALHKAVGGQRGWMEGLNNRGKVYMQVYEPVASLGWGLVAQQPVEEVFRQNNITAFTIFLTTIVSGIGSLLAIIYLRRK